MRADGHEKIPWSIQIQLGGQPLKGTSWRHYLEEEFALIEFFHGFD